jgi:hypothetical protein
MELTVSNLYIPGGVLLYNILIGIACIFWFIAYVLIIYRGIKDKACGMPMLVLCLNIVWEFILGFMGEPFVPAGSVLELSRHPLSMRIVDVIWFLFDCGVFYILVKYGKEEYEKFHPGAPKGIFVPMILFYLLISFLFIAVCVYEWHDYNGIYSAYVDNVLISALYIRMLWRRGNADGQSMWIGLFKFLGTFFTFLMGGFVIRGEYSITKRIFFELEFMPLIKLCFVLICTFEIAYMVFLYRTMKYKLHLNPWTRKPLVSV